MAQGKSHLFPSLISSTDKTIIQIPMYGPRPAYRMSGYVTPVQYAFMQELVKMSNNAMVKVSLNGPHPSLTPSGFSLINSFSSRIRWSASVAEKGVRSYSMERKLILAGAMMATVRTSMGTRFMRRFESILERRPRRPSGGISLSPMDQSTWMKARGDGVDRERCRWIVPDEEPCLVRFVS